MQAGKEAGGRVYGEKRQESHSMQAQCRREEHPRWPSGGAVQAEEAETVGRLYMVIWYRESHLCVPVSQAPGAGGREAGG